MARILTLSDTRPTAAKAASSSTVARRCDTRISRSPPRICRPWASSAASRLADRLPIPASAAVPRNRHSASSSRPRPPRRRSRNASRQARLMRPSDRRRCGRQRARTMRAQRAASAGSWVMTNRVVCRLVVPGEQQVHDLRAGGRIEVAGRLVGEDQRGRGRPARGRWRPAAARRRRAGRDSGRCGGRGRPPPARCGRARRRRSRPPAPAAPRHSPARSSSAAGGRPGGRCRCARAAPRASASSSSAAKSSPATSTDPAVGRSSPERIAISDDLPEPEGPSSATLVARGDVQVDAVEDVDAGGRATQRKP